MWLTGGGSPRLFPRTGYGCSRIGWIEWNDESVVELEFEFEFDARPLSRLVVEFRQPPLEVDSTVTMLALLSSPGLSRPGLCNRKQTINYVIVIQIQLICILGSQCSAKIND